MQPITIKHYRTNETLFEGRFSSPRHALEAAITDNTHLSGANLLGFDLSHANLDGCDLSNALLDDCDFTGANLSEVNFQHAKMRHTNLTMACLCESTMLHTDMRGASFGGTLINDTTLDSCIFSCPTAFTLPFSTAHAKLNAYEIQGHIYGFRGNPIVVHGFQKPIIILDNVTLMGDRVWKRSHAPEIINFDAIHFGPLNTVEFCDRP